MEKNLIKKLGESISTKAPKENIFLELVLKKKAWTLMQVVEIQFEESHLMLFISSLPSLHNSWDGNIDIRFLTLFQQKPKGYINKYMQHSIRELDWIRTSPMSNI